MLSFKFPWHPQHTLLLQDQIKVTGEGGENIYSGKMGVILFFRNKNTLNDDRKLDWKDF